MCLMLYFMKSCYSCKGRGLGALWILTSIAETEEVMDAAAVLQGTRCW